MGEFVTCEREKKNYHYYFLNVLIYYFVIVFPCVFAAIDILRMQLSSALKNLHLLF